MGVKVKDSPFKAYSIPKPLYQITFERIDEIFHRIHYRKLFLKHQIRFYIFLQNPEILASEPDTGSKIRTQIQKLYLWED